MAKTGRSRPRRRGAANRVTLRTEKEVVCTIPFGKALQQSAVRWSYIVHQRNRWMGNATAHRDVAERATAMLHELGVKERHLRAFASAGRVEVSVAFQREEVGWEARVMPWEYILSEATRPYRDSKRFVVFRHLDGKPTVRRAAPEPSLLIVTSAPGPELQGVYEFEGELMLVESTLRRAFPRIRVLPRLKDPTLDELHKTVMEERPTIIHLSAIDSHEGARLTGRDSEAGKRDGVCLRSEGELYAEASCEEIAAALTAAPTKPQFVGFNVWNSGARMASLTVAKGAGGAIGFEHTFDEQVAELFFANFYRELSPETERKVSLLRALETSLKTSARNRGRLLGTNVVLWSAESLISTDGAAAEKPAGTREAVGPQVLESLAVPDAEKIEADPRRHPIRDLVQVEVVPVDRLNYSMLHNRRSLLNRMAFRFVPRADDDSPDEAGAERDRIADVDLVRDIEVNVRLDADANAFCYSTKLNVGQRTPLVDLADRLLQATEDHPAGGIHVPLTSEVMRRVDELTRVSIFIEVRWHGQILYRHTHPIALAPVDEWRFEPSDVVWLPSFIQPRDPAVQRIAASAQRYLTCLSDYAGAGFDGYQSYDESARKLEDQWAGVDLQVKAIWWALVSDHRLHYINPPPSYSQSAQRLRTPSQVLAEGRGTCVDLAILLASCLEWVEIYPVIFLLADHAFPGYWRSLTDYEDFIAVRSAAEESPRSGGRPAPVRSEPWVFDGGTYREIRKYVDKGALVPIESTDLTDASSFEKARNDALEHLPTSRSRRFESMVDIVSARDEATPLPLCHLRS